MEFQRKYQINENFFKIWSPEMSYILGLWWADGSIYNINGKLREFNITLKNEEELLNKIKIYMKTDIPLRIHNKTGAKCLKITSKIICNDIQILGGMSNKSKIIGWPNDIPHEFKQHFIRGYFDGDGSIINKDNKIWISTFTSGSLSFIQKLETELHNLNPLINPKISDTQNWYVLYLNQMETKCLARIMYGELNDLYMVRKFEKFVQMHNEKGSQLESLQCKLTIDKVNEILNLIKCGYYTDLKSICNDYKIHRSTIDQIFSRKSWKKCTDKFSDVELFELRSKIIGQHNHFYPWMKR